MCSLQHLNTNRLKKHFDYYHTVRQLHIKYFRDLSKTIPLLVSAKF